MLTGAFRSMYRLLSGANADDPLDPAYHKKHDNYIAPRQSHPVPQTSSDDFVMNIPEPRPVSLNMTEEARLEKIYTELHRITPYVTRPMLSMYEIFSSQARHNVGYGRPRLLKEVVWMNSTHPFVDIIYYSRDTRSEFAGCYIFNGNLHGMPMTGVYREYFEAVANLVWDMLAKHNYVLYEHATGRMIGAPENAKTAGVPEHEDEQAELKSALSHEFRVDVAEEDDQDKMAEEENNGKEEDIMVEVDLSLVPTAHSGGGGGPRRPKDETEKNK